MTLTIFSLKLSDLDIKLITSYWNLPGSGARAYHHTAPISANYGLFECLRLVEEEGLEARWKRHRDNAELFWAGLEKIGLSCQVEYQHRLPSLTTVKVRSYFNIVNWLLRD